MSTRALPMLPTLLSGALVLGLAAPAAAERLPTTVTPEHYDLKFTVDLAHARFEGVESIRVQVAEPTLRVVLHALDIQFHEVTIGTGAAAQEATVSLNANDQTATLTVPTPIAKGAADVHIAYTGILNDQLRGFYLSTTKTRRYGVTQFESTDARRAFPCYDEPAFKATFAVTLVIDRGDTAISNGKVLSDTPGPSAAQHTVTFATSPKMSSYLVAMAVGDFQCLGGAQDGIPIRVCATPENKALVRVALESAQQVLKFYDNYFTIKYPFAKLDIVAVPDFAAGAMENTAAIFYRETDLLADEKDASVGARKNVASILAHEMAHQWFGDLVTLEWWDDIWLNEGFATWMANHPLAAWRPDWNVAVDEALENQTALNLDSLKSTRPIHARVDTPAQIDEAFDAIAYEKGAAVLRMIEWYVTPEAFRKGVNAYLQAHAYGNATASDFWNAIAASTGKPVDQVMPTFVNQPGAPLVTVSAPTCDAAKKVTSVTLTQQRFALDPRQQASASAERWQVPVCLTSKPSVSAPGTPFVIHCSVLEEPRQTVQLPGGCFPTVFANAGARGYYRTEYPPDMLRAMAPHVEEALSAPERLSLVGDEWALVRAHHHTVADYLTLTSGFGREQTSGVLAMVTARLAFLREYLTTADTRAGFEAFTRTLVHPLLDQLGFSPRAADTDEQRRLRAVVIDALGTTGEDGDVISRSRAALDRALDGGARLDATLAGPIVSVASEHGDATLYDALEAAADRATSPDEHYRYLFALTNFHDPVLIDRGLDYTLSSQLRSQDTAIYLLQFLGNPAARPRAWAFAKAHWTSLAPKLAISGGDTNFVGALSAFCDAGDRDDIKAFFAAHTLPAATRTLEQTVERINNCIDLREQETPALTKWVNSR
jgi:aminopeptidase N